MCRAALLGPGDAHLPALQLCAALGASVPASLFCCRMLPCHRAAGVALAGFDATCVLQ